MIKCKTIKEFGLENFDKLENVKRYNLNKNENKKLYIGDTFECDEEMARYLTGGNKYKEIVVEIVEVLPEKAEALTDNEEIQSFIGYTQIIKESKKPKKKKNK